MFRVVVECLVERKDMKITKFKAINKGSVVGFADVTMPSGMGFVDVMIMQTGGRYWASPPSKPILEKGVQKTDPETNKPVYVQIVTFASKELKQKWSDAVIAALRISHPDALQAE